VHATEVRIPSDAPNFAAGEHRFTLRGQIDRIDRHEESGRARIVDYKTGETIETPEKAHRSGRSEAKRWKSLQLPLYRHLAPLLGIEGEVEVGFVLLPGDLSSIGYVPSGFGDEDHDDAIACAREKLLAIRAGIFWPPGDLRAPWDRLFAGELPGARERFARGAGENGEG
jgi:ATP-dependent helicase/nuclease subunit B